MNARTSKLRRRWASWQREEAGNFSLESSMVLPMVVTVVIAMLMFGMYVYQQTALYYVSSTAAERTAFVWSNSHRDPGSGIAPIGQYDGLYWRVGDDGSLQALFQLAGSGSGETVVPLSRAESDQQTDAPNTEISLPENKLENGQRQLRDSYEGEFAYRNRMLARTIVVDLEEGMSVPLLQAFGYDSLQTRSGAVIVEPTELIRSVDLARYYMNKWNNQTGGAAQRANAAEVVTQQAQEARTK